MITMHSTEWNKRWGKDLVTKEIKSSEKNYYGTQWGNPDTPAVFYWLKKFFLGNKDKAPGDLSKVIKHYIKPYVTPSSVVLEIGSGGGRWTKYLLSAQKLILVELNSEFFPYLKKRFEKDVSKLQFYQTSGCELKNINSDSVDFVFSFGTFVHIDTDGIYKYLAEVKRVLKLNGIAVIQYGDKTKKQALLNLDFSDMNQDKMKKFIEDFNLRLLDHNTKLLNQSNIAVIQKSI